MVQSSSYAAYLKGLDEQALKEKIAKMPWFHSIDLRHHGIVTPGRGSLGQLTDVSNIYNHYPVRGRSVLDIGCYDGFMSFAMKDFGASRVVSNDYYVWKVDKQIEECYDLASVFRGDGVEKLVLPLDHISPQSVGQFQVVLFAGIFYHLMDPIAVLKNVSAVASEQLILETHMDALDVDRPAMIFYPDDSLNNDPTNWWGPNPSLIMHLLKLNGFSEVVFEAYPGFANRGIFIASR